MYTNDFEKITGGSRRLRRKKYHSFCTCISSELAEVTIQMYRFLCYKMNQ